MEWFIYNRIIHTCLPHLQKHPPHPPPHHRPYYRSVQEYHQHRRAQNRHPYNPHPYHRRSFFSLPFCFAGTVLDFLKPTFAFFFWGVLDAAVHLFGTVTFGSFCSIVFPFDERSVSLWESEGGESAVREGAFASNFSVNLETRDERQMGDDDMMLRRCKVAGYY